MTNYTCTNDRYDSTSDNSYDGVEDFQSMCEAVLGERADLHRVGDEWHDDQGTVLVPYTTVTIRRPGETAWAEGVPASDAEDEVERANRIAPGHRAYPDVD